jgi:hypothetical protein
MLGLLLYMREKTASKYGDEDAISALIAKVFLLFGYYGALRKSEG